MKKEELSEEWLSNHRFRSGASSSFDSILMQFEKVSIGLYESADHYSID